MVTVCTGRSHIAGVFSGPPCEGWSRARLRGGVAGFSTGDGGPRVIRTEEETAGLNTVKVKEARQLLLANRLLLFTISLFLVLLPQRKFMVMEHPSCPEEDDQQWMASVWKMYIIRCLVEYKDVQILTIYQGKFGGASPKPTTLMVLCGCDIDVNAHLDSFADVSVMPKALAMGWREDKKEYATASLKEYPVKLCQGLADLAGVWLQKRSLLAIFLLEQMKWPWASLYSTLRNWLVASTSRLDAERTTMFHEILIRCLRLCLIRDSICRKKKYIYISDYDIDGQMKPDK